MYRSGLEESGVTYSSLVHGFSNFDHTMEDPPHYKKFTIDVRRCIICERNAPDKDYIENPSIQAINKLITATSERCGYGESEWEHLNSRLHGSSANELLKTEFLITKTDTKMSPMDMLSTEQGLDLRKGQVRETSRPYSRRRKDALLHVIRH